MVLSHKHCCSGNATMHFVCFSHYLINGTIFRKKSTADKMVILIFSIKSPYNISLSKKNSEGYYHKRIQVFIQSTPSYCHTSNLNFVKSSYNPQVPNFMKIHPVGAKWFYADRHDEANSCFSEWCEHAKKISL